MFIKKDLRFHYENLENENFHKYLGVPRLSGYTKLTVSIFRILRINNSFLFQVQFLCTVTQIQIENLSITLTYIAAKEFKILNDRLVHLKSQNILDVLQKYHFLLFNFCKQIEKSFGLNITISVFTVLSQLLLMTFFETTLNIRPLKRNLMMDLYLVLNVLYAIMNLSRIATICRGCDLIRKECTDTGLKIEKLFRTNLSLKNFVSQVHLLRFRLTGCNLFIISMELTVEVSNKFS